MISFCYRLPLLGCFLVSTLWSTGQTWAQENSLGRLVANFELPDHRGRIHQLSDYQQDLIVIAFLGVECPLAKLYSQRLVELQAELDSEKVMLIGIDANRQDSLQEIAAHARKFDLNFPLLKDLGNEAADLLGATRTPEVFVLDQNRHVRYQGRIDDQYGIGYIKDKPENPDLKNAIENLLAGEEVETPFASSVGCRIGRIRQPMPDSEVTYAQQISRILQKRCLECHRQGQIAPFALNDYDEVVGWAEMIEEVVREQRMPPWHASPEIGEFSNDRSMTEDEKQLIYQWVAAAAPLGDPAQLPMAPEWTEGWQLPRKPDFTAPIVDQAVQIPAEGEVRYQYFSIDPGFDEDKWVDAIEIRPGNRAVVHHVLMFSGSKESVRERFGGGAGGYDAIYVPGQRVEAYPHGTARRIKANSELIFQVHFTPTGKIEEDQTTIGMTFVDPDSVEFEVRTASAVNGDFRIPPKHEHFPVEATSRPLPTAVTLLSFNPHMHLRGDAFFYEVILPDGSRQPLLNVPSYDFNWQTAYRLADPLRLPQGSRIHCTAHFNNSATNLNNPDPSKTVKWGEQTWDEMMIGYFDYVVPVRFGSEADAEPEVGPDAAQLKAEQWMQRLDKNSDARLLRSELPLRYLKQFQSIDANGDGIVDMAELKRNFSK